ncbi:ABC transporter ATP-binding protein [Tissierella sp. MB52-C2]|uniref:ABC transporter ATP-binding protein n=1 Tax=Tissierella sp. MB52-C2 TaxID=3070999 RepID=UPI00280BD861|nr:ABC transporter ATP-binding protein [Tissierella sp. MB52-C2]WMM24625.1 ABC transporter ATP-binding protein [Tissierella sp. MB52-C2]
MIELKNIYKGFSGKKVLNNISLVIEEGELVSLLGPSGCGKTTSLKIIGGLLPPDEGDILIDGKTVLNVPVEKRGIVIVFQDYLLFPHLNIEENIGFGLKMRKVPKKDIKIQVKKMLDLVKLKGYNKKYPNEISGGEQQRVALARALAIDPRVLLLDEPFSNLDTKLREEMRELTKSIQKKLNITTILVTHDKEEALMTSDKIAIMLKGEIKQFGTPEELYESPNSMEVADFMGDKNYISGSVINNRFIGNTLNFPINMEDMENVIVMVKPEDIRICPQETKTLSGIIRSKKYGGERIYYTVSIDKDMLKVVSNASPTYEVEDKVSIDINLEGIRLFKDEDR